MINLSDFTLNETSNNINLFDSIYLEESATVQTFQCLLEMNKEYNNASKLLYKNILEADSCEVVNESFTSFFSVMKEIIDRFLKLIKSLYDRFVTMIHRMYKGEKYLLKHKDDLKKFNSRHEFEFEGYTYTFDNSIPIIEAKAEFNKAFVSLDIDEFKDNNTAGILDYVTSITNSLKNELDNYYSTFRGEVIGKENYPINKEDYGNELFMVYRDGSDSKGTILVDDGVVNNSFIYFNNYKKLESELKKQKIKIEKEYEAVKKSIDHMISRNRDNDVSKLLGIDINGDYTSGGNSSIKVSEDVLNKLNIYIKIKTEQVEEMSVIHSMAFAYKLDAYKDCFIDSKKILYSALNRIQKDYKGGE